MSGRGVHRGATLAFSVLLLALGLVVLVRTAVAGGSALAIGYVIGVALIVVGLLRLWLLRKTTI
jgi:uncharacterized membrane protein HdeD (DUF308 family)